MVCLEADSKHLIWFLELKVYQNIAVEFVIRFHNESGN